MTRITIQDLPNVMQGDPVVVYATVSPVHARPVTASVSAHADEDSQPLDLRPVGPGGLQGTFRPDRPGRWWVAVSHSDVTAEACFWVKARQVRSSGQ